jgi:hypothetical protein
MQNTDFVREWRASTRILEKNGMPGAAVAGGFDGKNGISRTASDHQESGAIKAHVAGKRRSPARH